MTSKSFHSAALRRRPPNACWDCFRDPLLAVAFLSSASSWSYGREGNRGAEYGGGGWDGRLSGGGEGTLTRERTSRDMASWSLELDVKSVVSPVLLVR